MRNENPHFRYAGISSIIALWILCNYYTCTYTSLLAVPIYKPVVNSIEDLADSTNIDPITIKGSNVENYIMVIQFLNTVVEFGFYLYVNI